MEVDSNAVVGIGVFKHEVESVVLDVLAFKVDLPIQAYRPGQQWLDSAGRGIGALMDQTGVHKAGLQAGNGQGYPVARRADLGIDCEHRAILQHRFAVATSGRAQEGQIQGQFAAPGARLECHALVCGEFPGQPCRHFQHTGGGVENNVACHGLVADISLHAIEVPTRRNRIRGAVEHAGDGNGFAGWSVEI